LQERVGEEEDIVLGRLERGRKEALRLIKREATHAHA